MRKILAMIWGYFIFYVLSLTKIVSSMGQTFFGTRQATDYVFKTTTAEHSAALPIKIAAMTARTGTTLLTTVPVLRMQYGPSTESIVEEQPENDPTSSIVLRWRGKIANGLLISSSIFSSFNSEVMGTYFGTIVLSEVLKQLLRDDPKRPDEGWEIGLTQTTAIVTALMMLAPWYAYGFKKIIRPGARLISEKADDLSIQFDRHMAKTAIASGPMLIIGPAMAYYWTKPTFDQIPYANKFLDAKFIEGYAIASAVSAVFAGLPGMPLLYSYFANNVPTQIPQTALTKVLRACIYTFGGIDTLTGGAMTFVGVVKTAEGIFGIDPYHPGIIVAGGISALSAMVLNAAFSVKLGFETTAQLAYANMEPEKQPLLINDDESGSAVSYGSIQPASQPIDINHSDDGYESDNEMPATSRSFSSPNSLIAANAQSGMLIFHRVTVNRENIQPKPDHSPSHSGV